MLENHLEADEELKNKMQSWTQEKNLIMFLRRTPESLNAIIGKQK